MKHELKTSLIIIALFVLAQFIGLFTMNDYFQDYGREEFEEDESIIEPIYTMPLLLIITSIIFLLVYKINAKFLLILWYFTGIVISMSITLSTSIPFFYALLVSSGLALLKIKTKDDYFHNLCELITYAGISIILLPLLNTFNTIILLLIISVYDFIAVNLSKHMIKLAHAQFQLNTFSGFMLRTGRETAVLGGGDVLFPLLLTGVVFRDYSLLPAVLIIYGSMIGLMTLILIGRKDKFYPAMPFITGGSLLGLIIGLLFL